MAVQRAAREQPARQGDLDIGVVIATRDRADTLAVTLEHLLALPERPRILVVDNASSDHTRAMVADRFPHVEILPLSRNRGAAARTAGARALTTPYVAFSDDDSWWEPGALSRAADVLDRHPGLASVTARILVEPGGTEDPIVEELRSSPVPGPPWLPGPALGSFLAAATVMRVDAFRAVGGFSTRLWLGGEEELLATDLAACGWWLAYLPELTIHHAPSPVRDATGRRVQGLRNTLWFTWLRRPVPAALRRTLYLARTVPRDRASLRAFGLAVAGLPWVLRERKVVPAEVESRLRTLETAQRQSTARQYVG